MYSAELQARTGDGSSSQRALLQGEKGSGNKTPSSHDLE